MEENTFHTQRKDIKRLQKLERNMEVKENEKLEPIPDFDDKFWPKDADNRILNSKQVSCQQKHKFVPTGRANEVQCVCGVGYLLTPDLELKDGHVYFNNVVVV